MFIVTRITRLLDVSLGIMVCSTEISVQYVAQFLNSVEVGKIGVLFQTFKDANAPADRQRSAY